MKRVASLCLPFLATDRIRRLERAGSTANLSSPRGKKADSRQPEKPFPAPGRGKAAAKRTQGEDPLVTVHRAGQRMEIAAASREALALGLGPGMALTHARLLVPGLDVRDSDPAAETALLTRLAVFAARRWTPRAALSGPDGLWLDLGGTAHLFGGEENMCRRILHFCARLGLSARIAVAGTPGAAHALARYGSGRLILCPPDGEAAGIETLPLAALRIDEEKLAAARRLGLERIGDLFVMPRAPLERRFGKAFLLRLDQALGDAAEPFDPIVPEEPPSAALRLAEPVATAEAIATLLELLMARMVRTLAEAGLAARRLDLICVRVDRAEQIVSIGTARASRDGAHLLRLLGARIETIEPGFGIEAVRLVARRCEPLGPQPVEGKLAGDEAKPDLAPLVDRLANRIGARRLFRIGAIESDVPERSVRRLSPLAGAGSWPGWPRPVRLLSPPERVEHVMAELPDFPPRRFTWRGRRHEVRRADGPERIHGEWWKRTDEIAAVRDYFQVEDSNGARFWLYRKGDGADPRTGDLSWYLHGVFG